MLWRLLFLPSSRLRLSDDQHGTAEVILVPLRWIVVTIRLLAVAAVLSLGAIAVGWPFLGEANSNHTRLQRVETVSQCWDGLLYNAVKNHPGQAALKAEAAVCVNVQAKEGLQP